MAKPRDKSPSFEEALEQLEALVVAMEGGKVPLEQLITSYEKGAALVNLCESQLKNAELKLEQLKLGKATLEAFTLEGNEDE